LVALFALLVQEQKSADLNFAWQVATFAVANAGYPGFELANSAR
jgi:hypothetical protein